jgi:hypothetical protein
VPDPLGRHVQRRADHHVGAGDDAVAVDRRDPEVGEHHPAVVAQQHVGRFDVAVPHPGAVGGVQGGQHRQADVCDPTRLQRAVRPHDLLQRP